MPRPDKLDELDELRKLDDRLVIYAGPEISRAAGLPDGRTLAETLLEQAEDYLSARQHRELQAMLDEPGELPELLGEIERAMTAASFGRVVERLLDDADKPVPPLAQAIAGLEGGLPRGLRGVITPNLDHLLERAFEGSLVSHAQPVADLASRSGWLFKLHGTLRDRSTWVLTESQRGRVLYHDPMHRELFRSLFFAHPILFVGTRLDDPVLAEIIAQIKALSQGQPPCHWALVDQAEIGPTKRRKLAAAGITLIGYEGGQGDYQGCVEMLASLGGAEGPPAQVSAPAASVSSPAPVPSSAAAPAPAPAPTLAPAAQAQARPTPSTSAAPSRPPLSILFIAANPSGTDPLRLDRELRIIREAIERARYRDALKLEIRTAATVHDLRRALLEDAYDLIHISGHGEREGLILEDAMGEAIQVPRRALAGLFANYAPPLGSLRCVVLNACWSLATGTAASMDVPHTIAMDGPISDRGALEFSRGFYDALAAGRDFPDAYREGRLSVDLAAPGSKFDSVLLQS